MSTEQNQELIEKLRKIRALADSAEGENEGMAALLMYQKLLEKHGISEADVCLEDMPGLEPKDVAAYATGRLPEWMKKLAAVCADHMRCVIFWQRSVLHNMTHVYFCGLGDDADLAKELFNAAIDCAIRWCDEYLDGRTIHDRAHRFYIKEGYFNGFIYGLRDAFKRQEESGELGLIVVTPEVVKNRLKDSKEHKCITRASDTTALARGYADGKTFAAGDKLPCA